MKMFITFIKDMFNILNTPEKKKCFKKALFHLLFITIIGTITAPIIWPIFYLRRYKIFDKLKVPREDYNTEIPLRRSKVYLNWFDYILFLYGDKADPLCEKLPDFYEKKYSNKPHFIKWFLFSAIRNVMFNYRYRYLTTKHYIEKESPIYRIIDTRTDEIVHSDGISPLRKGKFLFWRYDNKGNPYFSYEHVSDKWIFYFGYTGLETLHNHETFYPRLEAAIRKIK